MLKPALRVALSVLICAGLPGTVAKLQAIDASESGDSAACYCDQVEAGQDFGYCAIVPQVSLPSAGPVSIREFPSLGFLTGTASCGSTWSSRAPPRIA